MILEKHLFASLIRHKLKNKKILVAVSGGMDSIALLYALFQLKEHFNLSLIVATIHHGPSKNKKTNQFRTKSIAFVREAAKELGVPLVIKKHYGKADSESEMREVRYENLRNVFTSEQCDVIAVAHHKDDLLESRLIRLIRGVGGQGLRAMSEMESGVYRPFLGLRRADIEDYVSQNELKFLNDPSNQDKKYLRNWLRYDWLPRLEKYRPGSASALAKSLDNLAADKGDLDLAGLVTEEGISRSSLIGLGKGDKRRVVAHYLRQKNVKNYTSSQIDEILKRLDTSQKVLTFRVSGLDWTVDTRHIRCLTS